VTAADFLIQNGGRLDPVWFEPHDLNNLLTAWLAASSGSDQAVEALVYARAFETLVDAIMITAASERVGSISAARSDEQLRYWQRQAAYWRGKADALTSGTGPAIVQWEGDPLWRN